MIDGYLVGDSEVVRRFDQLGAHMRDEMKDGIGRLTLRLQRNVKVDKLSGQVLGVRTGRGRRSIQQVVFDAGPKVVGVVSTAVFYMIGWEYGWPDSPVKASISAAKAKFKPKATSGTGKPRERSFLRTALRDLEASGAINAELDAIAAGAVR